MRTDVSGAQRACLYEQLIAERQRHGSRTSSNRYSPHLPSTGHTSIGSATSATMHECQQRFYVNRDNASICTFLSIASSSGGCAPSTPGSARHALYAQWLRSPSPLTYASVPSTSRETPTTPDSMRERMFAAMPIHSPDSFAFDFERHSVGVPPSTPSEASYGMYNNSRRPSELSFASSSAVSAGGSVLSSRSSTRERMYADACRWRQGSNSPSEFSANTPSPMSEQSSVMGRNALYEAWCRASMTQSPDNFVYEFPPDWAKIGIAFLAFLQAFC